MNVQSTRAKEIFITALQRSSPDARDTYLETACGGDADLRKQVEALLMAHDSAGSFLEHPALECEPAPTQADQPAATQPIDDPNGDQTVFLEASQPDELLDLLDPPAKPGQLGKLSHYELLEVVGHGGMGVVLKGHDPRLHRIVAIKVLAPQLASSATARRRFIREAQAAAAISHDHVVTIHAVEEAKGLPYLVMQYVGGESLKQRVDRVGPLELREILRIGMQTAAGLAAAHAQGLIHRDIKPANILLENGVDRVKITDFGLARAVDDAQLTQTGVVTGTPQYMAPEQARGDPIDYRADLFSLGSVLYAMCTGRAPFRASSSLAVLRRVSEDTPRPIQQINSEIPGWFIAIIEKLHAKAPADRYQSAAEVAEVLKTHLARLQGPSEQLALAIPEAAGLPQNSIKPSPTPTRVPRRRWAAAAAVIALVLGGAALTAPYVIIRIRGGSGEVTELKVPPGSEVEIDQTGKIAASLPSTRRRATRPRFIQPVPTIIKPEPLELTVGAQLSRRALVARPAGIEGVRSWSLDTRGHRGSVYTVTWSPDGNLLATTDESGTIRLWEADTGRLVRALVGRPDLQWCLAWSPDGRVLAVGGHSYDSDHVVRLWDVASGQPLYTIHSNAGDVHTLVWSPDGRTLAFNSGLTVALWDVKSGQTITQLRSHTDTIQSIAWASDATLLASGGEDKTVRIWDAESGVLLRTLEGYSDSINSIAWAPDGEILASKSVDGTVQLRDTQSGSLLRTWRAASGGFVLPSLAWSPDGRALASSDEGNAVDLWNAETGRPIRALKGHSRGVLGVDWSPDGTRLASCAADSTVRLWDAETGHLLRTLPGHPFTPLSLAWSPDRQVVASHHRDATIKLRDTQTGRLLRSFPVRPSEIHFRPNALAWSPDGRTLALGGAPSHSLPPSGGGLGWGVTLFNAESGKSVNTFRGHSKGVPAVAWSPDGRTLASGSEDTTVQLWEVESGRALRTLQGHAKEVTALAWSSDGMSLASASRDNTLQLWEVDSGRVLGAVQGHTDLVTALSASPDGGILASGGWENDKSVRLSQFKTGRLLRTLIDDSGPVRALAWSPNGETLASANWNLRTVRLWDVQSGELRRSLQWDEHFVYFLAWFPDGKTLASANFGHTWRLWDPESGQLRRLVLALDNLPALALSPDGHYRGAGDVNEELVYIVQTEDGQETLTPEEFASKYGWKNDPMRVGPGDD